MSSEAPEPEPILAEVVDPTPAEPVLAASPANLDLMSGPRWLHPVSLLFEFISGLRHQLFPAIIALFSLARGGTIGLVIAIGFFSVSMLLALMRYITLRYELRREELIVDQGIIFKRRRTIPVQRIQNIDLLQNPLHRIFGVAEVKIESASGTEPEATLRVLSLSEVELLRSQIALRRSLSWPTNQTQADTTRGACPAESINVNEERPQLLLSIPTSLLIKTGLVSNRGMVVLALVIGGFFQFSGSDWFRLNVNSEAVANWLPRGLDRVGMIALACASIVALMLVLRIFSAVWYVLKFHGYTLERFGEELRVRCGLLTKIAATVPRRRIQFISIHRSWLGMKLGIASIRIETAGGAGKTEDAAANVSRRWFVPAIAEKDVGRLLEQLRPGLNWDEPKLYWTPISPRAGARMRRLSLAVSVIIGAILAWFWAWWGVLAAGCLCALGIWLANKKARAMRYARGDFGVAYRSGLLIKKCSITFLDKVQAVSVSHSPFDRRWGMATLALDTAAAGPAEHRIEVAMLDRSFAHSECDAIARLASQHRARFR